MECFDNVVANEPPFRSPHIHLPSPISHGNRQMARATRWHASLQITNEYDMLSASYVTLRHREQVSLNLANVLFLKPLSCCKAHSTWNGTFAYTL